MMVLLAIPVAMATGVPDDDDKDPVIKPGIRRLHPGRERAKAIKKLQEQMSRKAEPKADPWDTSDEVWGTVDLPPVATRDSNAVEGRRLTPGAGLQQAGDESLTGRGGRRMTWRDLPVTATIDQLMPGFTVAEDGDYYSRYVSRDKSSNEVYFVFNMQEDSVPGPLRLCVQYCGDDPLDFDQLLFTIDGFDYPFYPSNTRGGELEGNLCWAQSDDELQPIHKDLVFALAHGRWVAIKLLSTRGINHVKMLTDGQRDDFAHTLNLYRPMGGKL
jgi:hypothetical protein